jgi:rhodanese-related sulfurtransferase
MNHRIGVLPIVLLSLVAGLVCRPEKKAQMSIGPAEAYDMIKQDTSIVLLDVRTPGEYTSETGHLKDALLIPVQELEQRIGELDRYKGRKIIAYCRSGHRSAQATSLLNSRGFTTLNMEGGILGWNEKKLPVVNEEQK